MLQLIPHYLKTWKISPPNNSSLEAKALQVIEEKTFNIPRHLLETMKPSPEAAKQYIKEKWPMKEAVDVLKDLNWAEIIPFQTYKARFDTAKDGFKVTGLKSLTEVTPNGSDMTNIFFEKPLNEAQVKKLPIEEEKVQRYYQLGGGDVDSPSLRKVYIKEVERLLKEKKIIYDRHTLEDHEDKLIIVQLPKEKTILVLTPIREWSYRNTSRFSTLIFNFSSTQNSKKFVDFLYKHNVAGLNAFYSLLLSEQLTPDIPINDRYQTFFVNDYIKKPILAAEASLKEYPIQEGLSVYRLRSIEN